MKIRSYIRFVYLWHLFSWIVLYIPLRTLFRFDGTKPRDGDITSKPLLIVVNHKSMYDPWFFTHILDFRQFSKSAPMQAMATQRFDNAFLNLVYYIFIKPFIYYPYGVVYLPKPKENGNGLTIEEKTRPFVRVIEDDGSIFMFPEGRLNRLPGIHNFKRGAGYLQKKTGVPILLASIRFRKKDGTPSNSWWIPWVKRIVNWDQELTYIPRSIINDPKKTNIWLREKMLKLYRDNAAQ